MLKIYKIIIINLIIINVIIIARKCRNQCQHCELFKVNGSNPEAKGNVQVEENLLASFFFSFEYLSDKYF